MTDPEQNTESENQPQQTKNNVENELAPIDTTGITGQAKAPAEAQKEEEPVAAAAEEEPSEEKAFEEALNPAPEDDEDADMANFDNMVEDYLGKMSKHSTGQVVTARVVDVKRLYALLDIGDKAEGVVDINEFADTNGNIHLSVGDQIEVLLQQRDDETGQLKVSHRKAKERSSWTTIATNQRDRIPMTGRVFEAVNKGVIVDVGVRAFMPASQIDISRVEKLEDWVGQEVEVLVLEYNQKSRRVIVSRRQVIEKEREKAVQKLFQELEVGQDRTVIVKKIMDFGAFVDLGGIDGLIPRSEISWDVGAHPSEHLIEGHDLKATVIALDEKARKITLSRRRKRPDPWEKILEKYPEGSTIKGRVARMTNFEAFVAIEEGIQGRLHHTNLSWTKGRHKISEYLKEGDGVRCIVLSLDPAKRRMSLGLKQLSQDPWTELEGEFPIGSKVTGEVVSLTNFGAFVRLNEYIDGMVHISDLTWDRNTKSPAQLLTVGQQVEAIVLSIDLEQRRVNLGIKQLETSPFETFTRQYGMGKVVEGKVVRIMDFGVIVELSPSVDGVIRISQLAEERVEKASDVVGIGDIVKAIVVKIESKRQRIELSRQQYLRDEEKREIATYMNRNESGGQSLAELLSNIQLADADPNEAKTLE